MIPFFPRRYCSVLVSIACLYTVGGLWAQIVATTTTASPFPAAYPTGVESPLGQRVAALLADPAVNRAHWGIAVTAMDGTPLYGLDEGQVFRPASTAKLFTTVTAMAMLGPDRRFTTRLVAEGPIQDGVLHGNLLLVGGGDANFAPDFPVPYTMPQHRVVDPLKDVEELASAAKAAGLKRIDGNVVGDDTRFEYIPYASGVDVEDLTWGYGAPVSALVLHNNYVDMMTAAKGAGGHAVVELSPAMPYYTVNAKPAPGETWKGFVQVKDAGPNSVSVLRVPSSNDLTVRGTVSVKNGPDHEEIAIDEPARYGAMALRDSLLKVGVTAAGVDVRHYRGAYFDSYFPQSRKASENPFLRMNPAKFFTPGQSHCDAQSIAGSPEHMVLAEHTSPTLIDDIVETLKTSDNLHAEVMLRNVGVERDCMNNYLSTALQMENEFMQFAGLNRDDVVLYDGSGLSMKDLIAPRAETQLLAYAAKQPWFAQWKAALPVGGVDGTLSGRFKGTKDKPDPLKGRVFAKTGTLGESRALAGYVECASGRTVIFSVMVDTHLPGGASDREAMDKIVSAIAETQ